MIKLSLRAYNSMCTKVYYVHLFSIWERASLKPKQTELMLVPKDMQWNQYGMNHSPQKWLDYQAAMQSYTDTLDCALGGCGM